MVCHGNMIFTAVGVLHVELLTCHVSIVSVANQVRGDWKRVVCHGNMIFTAVGVLHVELLACHVSIVSVAN